MAGIYIHIPFCRSRCIYCGFYSTTHLDLRQRYINALCRELEVRGEKIDEKGERIETIYLGGGTPSQLTDGQLRQLFEALTPHLSTHTSHIQEVTIEVNPDDVTEEFAEALPQLGINRVSMGAQTFDDERLLFLHRRHTADQVGLAVQRLRAVGIRNISVDLMYGFPGETLDDWQRDIDRALALDVEHLSAYCLMVEEGTKLYELKNYILEFKNTFPDEETERQMYETLIDRLTAAGFEHYEISNFARPTKRSRHNSSYWTDVPYLGLGAAAHSYDRHSRQWNPSDILQYIKGIEEGNLAVEREVIDDITRYNDRVMLSLRTCEGINLDNLSKQNKDYLLPIAQKYLDEGLLELSGNRLRLSREGLFVSDMVMSDLMRI